MSEHRPEIAAKVGILLTVALTKTLIERGVLKDADLTSLFNAALQSASGDDAVEVRSMLTELMTKPGMS